MNYRMLYINERKKNNEIPITKNSKKVMTRWRSVLADTHFQSSKINLDDISDLIEGRFEPNEKGCKVLLDIESAFNDIFSVAERCHRLVIRLGVLDVDENKKELPYQAIVHPVISYILNTLESKFPNCSILSEDVLYSLGKDCANRVLDIVNKTMILELYIAKLEGKIFGDTSEDRFKFFGNEYLKSNIDSLMTTYPMLKRRIVCESRRIIDFYSQMIIDVQQDEKLIREHFGLEGLRQIEFSGSDLHDNGKTVAFFIFNNGKLVYKPRNLDLDVRFGNFVADLNLKFALFDLKLPKTLNCGSHGWCEFIHYSPCPSNQLFREFYERQGRILALLYVLNASDLHYENLIANGGQPVLIDIECLFQNTPSEPTGEDTAYMIANRILDESVLRVGLLPNLVQGKKDKRGIDISEFGGQGGQRTPYEVPVLSNMFTDDLFIDRKHGITSPSLNIPFFGDTIADPLDYLENIVSGFTRAYLAILENKSDVICMIDEYFSQSVVRYIARNTQRYATLTAALNHPDTLRDAIEVEIISESLLIETAVFNYLNKILHLEQENIIRGDIPVFYNNISSTSLICGSEKIKDYFILPAIDRVYSKIDRLSADDLSEQVKLIQSSFASIDDYVQESQILRINKRNEIDSAMIEGEIEKISREIRSGAIIGKDSITWIGSSIEGIQGVNWIVSPVNSNLYDGTAGIALSLAYADLILESNKNKDIIELCCHSCFNDLVNFNQKLHKQDNIGAFSGITSIAYAILNIKSLGYCQDISEQEILRGVSELSQWVEYDGNFGLLDGTAGALMFADSVSSRNTNPVDDFASKCLSHLLVNFRDNGKERGWISRGSEVILGGLSHGIAGMVLALSGRERYKESNIKEIICRALEYERSLFNPAENNWKDLRGMGNLSVYPVAWCHGAAGIGLGRKLLHQRGWRDDFIEGDIHAAINAIYRKGYTLSDSLCHGKLGNFDILRTLCEYVDRYDIIEELPALYNSMITQGIDRGWRLGLPKNANSPGLMLGKAGILYGMLRIHSPHSVPDILSLEIN